MLKTKAYIIQILFFALGVIFIIACSVEQKIAAKYQIEVKDTPVLLRLNQEIFLTNSKMQIPEGIDELDQQAYYDTALYNSDFIQYIDANRYIDRFNMAFTEALSEQGFLIFPADSITSFLKQRKPAVIIEIEQIEIEEYFSEYADNYTYRARKSDWNFYKSFTNQNSVYVNYYENGDIDFEIVFDINTISVNAWVNIGVLYSDGKQSQELVFMQFEISDIVEGKFNSAHTVYENDIKYSYNIDSLKIQDLYGTEEYPPKKFSQQIANYLVNHVIEYRLLQSHNKLMKRDWEYSSKSGRILPLPPVEKYEDGPSSYYYPIPIDPRNRTRSY